MSPSTSYVPQYDWKVFAAATYSATVPPNGSLDQKLGDWQLPLDMRGSHLRYRSNRRLRPGPTGNPRIRPRSVMRKTATARHPPTRSSLAGLAARWCIDGHGPLSVVRVLDSRAFYGGPPWTFHSHRCSDPAGAGPLPWEQSHQRTFLINAGQLHSSTAIWLHSFPQFRFDDVATGEHFTDHKAEITQLVRGLRGGHSVRVISP